MASRHTFKQELINQISALFKRSSLNPIPTSCLQSMSTQALAEFKAWVEPLIQQNPSLTPASHRLLPKKK